MKKEDLQGYSIYEAIEYVKSLEEPYVRRPIKPLPKINANSKELREHLEVLEQWELEISEYGKVSKKQREDSCERNSILEDYIKDQSGLYTVVPKDKQDKVWAYAWQQGHSSGYSEVAYYLQEIIEIFE